MIFIYRLFLLLAFPLLLPFMLVFSRKFRDYFLKREKNLSCLVLNSELPSNTKVNKNDRPILIHASSGEFEHAKYLVRSIKDQDPKQKIIASYSSPSYFKAIKKFDLIDGYIPMPMDLKGPISSFINQVNPKIVLFARTDLWPEMIHQTKARKIPTLVFARMERTNANLIEKILNSMTYRLVNHISFVSKEDEALFFSKFKYSRAKISTSVDGDPRVEEVLLRSSQISHEDVDSINRPRTLILGSVWNEDLEVIAKPILSALESGKISKVIAAPHDPETKHINELLSIFKKYQPTLYSSDSKLAGRVIIVDQTGVLFSLYSKADVAFIGGSFKKKVHSVIEPLSFGLPVLVGSKIENNREAQFYSKNEFSYVKVSNNQSEFKKQLNQILSLSESEYKDIRTSIKTSLNASKGASDKIIQVLNQQEINS